MMMAQQSLVASPVSASWLDYVPIVIATLALLVSLVLGLRNRGTAKRALQLSERQEARRDSAIDLYLNESVSWRQSAWGHRLVGLHILATNPTDRASSLVRAELRLTYAVDGVVTTIKVPHASDPTMTVSPIGVTPMDLPAALDANSAVSGWLLFRLEDGLADGRPIDRYDVAVRDVHGIEETMQMTVLREVRDDETP